MIGFLVAAVVVVGGVWAVFALGDDGPPAETEPRPTAVEEVEEFSDLARDHTTEPVTYEETPPVGGAHDPTWQTCAFYEAPIRAEHAVHSMEHGAVWITYDPALPEEQVAEIRALVEGDGYLLASPYEGLPSPVVTSAWGLQLQLDGAEDPRLGEFVAAYGQGPQTPEPGASCAFGIEDTVG